MCDFCPPCLDEQSAEFENASQTAQTFWPATKPRGAVRQEFLPSLDAQNARVQVAFPFDSSLTGQPRVVSERAIGNPQKYTCEAQLDDRPSGDIEAKDGEVHICRPRQATCLCSSRLRSESAKSQKKKRSGMGYSSAVDHLYSPTCRAK